MRYTEPQFRRLAHILITRLLSKDLIVPKANITQLEDRVTKALLRNFQEELEIEREATRVAETHKHAMAGMDRRKIITLIKEKLAREKGFVL